MTLEACFPYGRGRGSRYAEVKVSPMAHHLRGLSWTASGYGERIPTQYMIRVDGRWRRVYAYHVSNAETLFIGKSLRDGTIIDIYNT